MLFYNFRTYSFSKPASQPTHPFLSLFQGLQLIQFHLSTNRVASCRRCIPNRAHNHCLFIYRLRAFLPILTVNTPVRLPAYRPTSLPTYQPANLPANAPDVFCLGIPNPAHGLTPHPGVTGPCVECCLLAYLCRLWIVVRWPEFRPGRTRHAQIFFILGLRAFSRPAYQPTHLLLFQDLQLL